MSKFNKKTSIKLIGGVVIWYLVYAFIMNSLYLGFQELRQEIAWLQLERTIVSTMIHIQVNVEPMVQTKHGAVIALLTRPEYDSTMSQLAQLANPQSNEVKVALTEALFPPDGDTHSVHFHHRPDGRWQSNTIIKLEKLEWNIQLPVANNRWRYHFFKIEEIVKNRDGTIESIYVWHRTNE